MRMVTHYATLRAISLYSPMHLNSLTEGSCILTFYFNTCETQVHNLTIRLSLL
jgi:hypothetical protein